MSWHALSLSLRLRGDIHCGDLPLGFVARTYPFVPCHIPFFAMIPPTVEGLGMPSEHASYKAVERLFTKCLRSTPLFIRDERVLFPWRSKDLRILETAYLGSRYGVMLEDQGRTAEEGHLYETEVILATKRDSTEPTCLEGALFYRAQSEDDLALTDEGRVTYRGKSRTLTDILACMRLGGDRTRALGLPANVCPPKPLEGSLWGKYSVHCGEEWPVLEVGENECGPLPLALKGAGEIEGLSVLLTGRRYTKRGAGMSMDTASAAYTCGWKGKGQSIRIALSSPRYAVRLG